MAAKSTTKTKSDMAPLSLEGQTLGKYRILEPLGRGGMAQVYKAYHPQLDRYVAVKVLRSDLVEETEFLARFRREARAVAALRHANIVQIFDFDAQDDLYYMVMELLEGNTLKAHLNALRVRGERLPFGAAVRIFCDVLAGLAYAHGEGVIHRDLKPANIMLTRKGQAVLTDFGIAQIVGGTQYTVSGALMGTLSYMAPEQGRDGRSDARSDTYSLGIAIYEALTGSVPYDADTPLAILMKHINDPLPLPRKLNPEIPERLETFVLKALAKNPEDRFQSALEMADALRASARESGIDIPERIELPRPSAMTTASQVSIYSGKARQEIAEDAFASEDTDITFGRSRRSSAARLDQVRSMLETARSDGSPGPLKVSQSVLAWVGTLTLGNMLMLWLSGIFGWDLFGRIWPMEIVLVGLLLAALMAALPNYWLIIPAGILLGNGYLLSYYALTGNWSDWTYLWPLEPILVGTALILPFILHRDRARGLWRARRLGLYLVILSIVVFFVSLIVGTIRSI